MAHHRFAPWWRDPGNMSRSWRPPVHPHPRPPCSFQACRFSHFVLGVEGALNVVSSRRVCGLAGIQLSGKREAKQARPLSVKEIQDLHRAAASVTNRQAICCLWHTVGAGTATRWQWKMCCMITRKVPGMFNSGPSTTRVASRQPRRVSSFPFSDCQLE